MSKIKHLLYILGLSVIFSAVLCGFSEQTAEASSPTTPTYHFSINNKNVADGGSYEILKDGLYVYALGNGGAVPASVTWTTSDENVISLQDQSGNHVKLMRNGPGYATITATITDNGMTYFASFVTSVALDVDHSKTGTDIATTTNAKVLVINSIGTTKQMFLKYVDYTDESNTSVSGAAISVSGTSIRFESDNHGVATVDANGVIKAEGSGSAVITATTDSVSPTTGSPMIAQLRVVVKPTFNLTYGSPGNTTSLKSVARYTDYDPSKPDGGVYTGVPSNFTLQTDPSIASNLVWVVYSIVDGKKTKINEGTTAKMTYNVINGYPTVSFSNVKTGTYEIYAFTYKDFNEKCTNVPYACMKIYVPIIMDNINIVMNVDDTYNLLDNSNLTDTHIFVEPTGYDTNVALFDYTDYTIEAKKQGTTTITLKYDPDQSLYDNGPPANVQIKVTVIDGIKLSTSNATIATGTELVLVPYVTDSTAAITWSSSDPTIASVASGKVKGLKNGTVIITAKQKINGVVKKATCTITVQASVATVTVTANKNTLAIGEFLALHATVTPADLVGVKLTWRSSDESVVTITDSDALNATVQGKAGGRVVITAIANNIVVGYYAITVQQPVTGIEMSIKAANPSLSQKTLQLSATIAPDNAVNKNIIWSSTDTSKATVDQNGLVTLLKAGTVTIVATSEDNAKAVAYCILNIQIPVTSLALDETTKTMYVGDTARMSYIILPSNASNNVVTWISTNPSAVTVDTAGKVTAKGVGTSVIILKSADGGFTSYCTITVKMVATAIKFDVATLKLKTGEYYVLKTILTPKGSTENDITWESSDTKVATVDSEGKIVAKTAGSCIIMARTLAGGVAYCTVTVTQGVSGLVLNFSDKTIYKGESFTLEASVSPTSATKLDVTWKSSNTKIATVDSKGVVKGIVGGVTIITCTTADGGYAATCVLTVKETVTKIKLNHETYNLGINKTVKLIATVSNETATNQKVTWTSSNEKVATVTKAGKVIGLKAGYTTITAIAQDGSEVEASCDLRVVTLVTNVSLSKTTMAMFVGESKKLKASIKPSNATLKKAKWSSSDKSIAIVDEDGNIIAIKAGSVMITASAFDSSGKKAICYVTVYDRLPSTGITLQDKKVTLVPGETKIIEMVLIPSASTDDVTWSSDNAAIASVNRESGKITAKAPGTAYITVMTDSGKTATVEVTVIGLNEKQLITEQYTDYPQALTVEGATGTVKWQSSNPLVATIKSDGTVGARGVGTATITATVNGRKLTCKIIVKKMT